MAENRIAVLRRELGLNQRELGEQLGVGQTTISAWETGKNEPDYESIRKMAELFEASADYLLGFTDDHLHRGLTPEQWEAHQKRIIEKLHDEELQKDIAKALEQEYEEYEEDREDALYWEWKDSGKPVQFETFKAVQLMEECTREQREQVLEHIKIVMKYGKK